VKRHPKALPLHVAISGAVAVAVTVTWAVTGGGYFWPGWILLVLAYLLLQHGMLWRWRNRPADFFLQLDWVLVNGAFLFVAAFVMVPLGGDGMVIRGVIYGALFGGPIGLVAWLLQARFSSRGAKQLEERIGELTRTRRGALDVQADELRRIERDIHDGAQARLVALSMQLGRAEEDLEDQPEAAQLVRQARGQASAAIAELRALARGIAPPVLADRGLAAAVEALAAYSATPVDVEAGVDRRLPLVIESAAYFVVAESLTNVAKHADGATAQVSLRLRDDALMVEVADNGPGGADPDGGGLSGMRRRVEALDGSLILVSAAGQGTTVQAELPCE